MVNCEVCGNSYENPIEVRRNGKSHWYDCLECAIHGLAPKCERCGVRILGHGVESNKKIFCGAHCSRVAGHPGAVDHVGLV